MGKNTTEMREERAASMIQAHYRGHREHKGFADIVKAAKNMRDLDAKMTEYHIQPTLVEKPRQRKRDKVKGFLTSKKCTGAVKALLGGKKKKSGHSHASAGFQMGGGSSSSEHSASDSEHECESFNPFKGNAMVKLLKAGRRHVSLGGAGDAISEQFEAFQEKLNDIPGILGQGAEKVGEFAGELADMFGGLCEELGPGLESVFDAIGDIANEL